MRFTQSAALRGARRAAIGGALLAALVSGSAVRAASSDDVAPTVAITSPSSGTQVEGSSVDVTVAFNATANDPQEPTGNVTLVELALDGSTVGGFTNPPGTKSGSHTFGVDLSGAAAGEHTLVARAYQGNPDAGHVGTSGAGDDPGGSSTPTAASARRHASHDHRASRPGRERRRVALRRTPRLVRRERRLGHRLRDRAHPRPDRRRRPGRHRNGPRQRGQRGIDVRHRERGHDRTDARRPHPRRRLHRLGKHDLAAGDGAGRDLGP